MSKDIEEQVRKLIKTPGLNDIFVCKALERKLEKYFLAGEYENFMTAWGVAIDARLTVLSPLHKAVWARLAYARNELLYASPDCKENFKAVWGRRREKWLPRLTENNDLYKGWS